MPRSDMHKRQRPVGSAVADSSFNFKKEEPSDVESDTGSIISFPEADILEVEQLYFPRYKKQKLEPHKQITEDEDLNEVTRDTLENARSVMSMEELETLLVRRDLPRRATHEDHALVVARINQADFKITAKQLIDLMKEAYIPLPPTRLERIRRLQKHDADSSVMGRKGVKSIDMAFKRSYEAYEIYGFDP